MKSEICEVFPLGLTRKVWVTGIFKFLPEVIIASLVFCFLHSNIWSIQWNITIFHNNTHKGVKNQSRLRQLSKKIEYVLEFETFSETICTNLCTADFLLYRGYIWRPRSSTWLCKTKSGGGGVGVNIFSW